MFHDQALAWERNGFDTLHRIAVVEVVVVVVWYLRSVTRHRIVGARRRANRVATHTQRVLLCGSQAASGLGAHHGCHSVRAATVIVSHQ